MSITDIQPGTTFRWKDYAFRRLTGARDAIYLGSLSEEKDPIIGAIVTFITTDQSLIPTKNLTNITKP